MATVTQMVVFTGYGFCVGFFIATLGISRRWQWVQKVVDWLAE